MNRLPKFLRCAFFALGFACCGAAVAASDAGGEIACENDVCAQSDFYEISPIRSALWVVTRLAIGLDVPEGFATFRAVKADKWLADDEYENLGDAFSEVYGLSENDCVVLIRSEYLESDRARIPGYALNPRSESFNGEMNRILAKKNRSNWYLGVGTAGGKIDSGKILKEWQKENSPWDKQVWTSAKSWESFGGPLCRGRGAAKGLAAQ